MAVDQFLKIGALKGESEDSKYGGWIDVLAWSFGVSQSATMHGGGGGGGGKANVENLNITKYIDSCTTNLFANCFSGKHFPDAHLIVRKAGDEPLEYMKIDMTEVIISNISTGGSGGEDRLTENISLNFKTVKIIYTEQDGAGAGKGAMEIGYDIAKNEKM